MVEDAPDPMTPLTLMQEHAVRDSFETFKDVMPTAMLFPKKPSLRRYCVRQAVAALSTDGLFCEFGVWRGHGVNLMARMLAEDRVTVWGFDSFVGLEEDWTGHARGAETGRYSLDGVLPDVHKNVRLVKGWVQDTVPGWLEENAGPLIFAHMDMDTYSPTAFTLGAIRHRLVAGSVILFDELYGYPGWREHEYKALQENLPADSYKFIGFSDQPVGIQMLRAVG